MIPLKGTLKGSSNSVCNDSAITTDMRLARLQIPKGQKIHLHYDVFRPEHERVYLKVYLNYRVYNLFTN